MREAMDLVDREREKMQNAECRMQNDEAGQLEF